MSSFWTFPNSVNVRVVPKPLSGLAVGIYFEMSEKTNGNVTLLFRVLIRLLLQRLQREKEKKHPSIMYTSIACLRCDVGLKNTHAPFGKVGQLFRYRMDAVQNPPNTRRTRAGVRPV